MGIVRICGLLSLMSMAAFGWNSVAFSNAAESPSDLSEYVYLHETRNQAIPLQIAARANMCRGTVGRARN